VTEPGEAREGAGREHGLEPVLGLRDLVFFYVCANCGIRLIPLAASIGPTPRDRASSLPGRRASGAAGV